MKTIFLLILIFLSSTTYASCVILLHGLARSVSSMEKIGSALSAEGHEVINLGYSSRKHAIKTLATLAIEPALKACKDAPEISFVTHSLGGVLVREYLSTQNIPNLKHVVMLGPPNQGSEVVDKLKGMPGFHFLNGDAGMQLGTDHLSAPNRLGPANFDLGIIAGNQSINWILSMLIPGEDDGKVSITRTKLEGMNDHIVLATTHPFMMKNSEAISQVIYYLANGNFNRNTN